MIISDYPEKFTEEELNKVYVTNEQIKKWKMQLEPYHEVISIEESLDKYHPSDTFKHNCLIEGYKLKALYAVYHQGWEMDEWAASATKDGKEWFITTSHGSLCPEEVEGFALRDLMEELFTGWKKK